MSVDHTVDASLWYAIYTNPRQEMRVESNLKAWGIETYLPKVKELCISQYTSNRTWSIKPLFLRYLFARFRFKVCGHKIRNTRGVRELVGFGEAPLPVDDGIIKLIQARHDEFGYIKLEEEICPGDEIIVKDGIFKGIHGIFERRIGNSDRVLLLLKAIQFQAHIVVDRGALKKA